jgi:hypothetical protein
MLDAHPELAIPPETHFLPALIYLYAADEQSTHELVRTVRTYPGWRDFGLSEDELRTAFDTADPGVAGAINAFYSAYAKRHGKRRWGDKTPVYVESISKIGFALSTQARFVHLIRDGRAVAASRRARAAKRGREPTSARKEAETWVKRISAAREQAKEVDHYIELRYEDLIAESESALRRVCAHIELEFDPAMLSYHEGAQSRLSELSDLPGKGGKVRPGSERVAAHQLTSEPPRTDRMERWQTELDAASIADYEEVAGELLLDLGYPVG